MDYEFGQFYYAFKGIPYAKPPVKTLRFKAPVEVDSWSETLMATEDGNLCPQYDISQSESIGENFKCSDHFSVTGGLWSMMHCNYFIISGDENCLNLNVYSPKLDSKKRAVMVYFHGGAYIMGGKRENYFQLRKQLEKHRIVSQSTVTVMKDKITVRIDHINN